MLAELLCLFYVFQLAPGDMVMAYAGANTGDAAIIERHFPEAADPA